MKSVGSKFQVYLAMNKKFGIIDVKEAEPPTTKVVNIGLELNSYSNILYLFFFSVISDEPYILQE